LWHVEKCLNIIIHRTLVSTSLCHLNIFIVMNKSYETKNYMLHWCVYFIVWTVERYLIFGQLMGLLTRHSFCENGPWFSNENPCIDDTYWIKINVRCLPIGDASGVTQVVFRQPFAIQHVRTRFLSCETWNFLFFIYCLFIDILLRTHGPYHRHKNTKSG